MGHHPALLHHITKVYFPRLVIPLAAVLAGVVDGFRWALLGKAEGPGALLAVSVTVVILVLIGGLYYFRRMEKTFADVV